MASQNLSESNINSATSTTIDYRSRCVTERFSTGQYYFPKTIYKGRSNIVSIIIIGILILSVSLCIYISGSFIKSFQTLIFCLFSKFFWEFAYRLIVLVEEREHLIPRYQDNVSSLIKTVFSFERSTIILFVFVVLCMVWFLANNSTIFIKTDKDNMIEVFIMIAFIYFMAKLFYWGSRTLDHSSWILQDSGLDYGSGMAHSYFNGYLKLILPESGNEVKNLIELMDIYESRHNIKFECKKLIVLMPKSLNCHVSLENHSPTVIEAGKCLDEKKQTVAAVRDRVYKNSVYKLRNNHNRIIYVVAEYATPLKTFRDVTLQCGEHSENYRKLKCDIVHQFYKTLKRLLEENHLTEFCEIIFYDDMIGKDEFVDVGQIILTRLKELKKRERFKRE